MGIQLQAEFSLEYKIASPAQVMAAFATFGPSSLKKKNRKIYFKTPKCIKI